MTTEKSGISRRGFIQTATVMGIGGGVQSVLAAQSDKSISKGYKMKGRITQSVCKWCYGSIPMEKFAAYSAKIGLKSVELVDPSDWPMLKKHGLICAMSNSHGITKGLNRKENHEECLAKIRKSAEETAQAGFPNVICFSGNREGMDDDEGMKNCEIAVKEVISFIEKKKVTLCIELLNSKRNHW